MKETGKSYLERIVFDKNLLKGPIAGWVSNLRIVILLVIVIFFAGIVSFANIPRRLNPEIKIPIVTIITVLPGASPQDIESLVTVPLETQISSVSNISTLTSTSRDSVSAIVVQFNSGVLADKARQDVQSAVDTVSNLPTDVKSPTVKALDFEDRPIWTFTVQSNTNNIASLMRFANILKKNIENTPKVDRVVVQGFETQQIEVNVSPEKIAQYGIQPFTLSSLISSAINAYPAGAVSTGKNSFSLAIDPQAISVNDLRGLKISVGNQTVALSDIATVEEKSAGNQNQSYLATNNTEPRRVVTFNVYKTTGTNFDVSQKNIDTTVNRTMAEYKNQFTINTILNYSDEISKQYTDLLGEFRSTILLVMGCLFVFLGLRQALISSLTVPLTFLSAFVFMQILGMTINFLSLFAFLIALGLLVDDTIVTVQAMTTYYKTGKFTPFETGLVVWRDLIVPIWSTTITTIWSFVPLLLATGIIGEFIKPIPIVVTVTMISSTAIAVLITLPFMTVLLKPQIPSRVIILLKILGIIALSVACVMLLKTNPLLPIIAIIYIALFFVLKIVNQPMSHNIKSFFSKHEITSPIVGKLMHYADHGIINLDIVSQKYYWLIKKILASPKARKQVVIGIIIYAVSAFMLLPLGLVKNEFFPKTDEDLLYVNLSMPPGTSMDILRTESKSILETLRHTKYTTFTVADTGSSLSAMGASVDSAGSTLFTLHLTPKDQRHVTSYALAETLRNQLASIQTQGKLTVVELSSGPPAGAELQIKLSGDDLAVLNQYADKIVTHLDQEAGVTNVDKSIKSGTPKIVFVPNLQKISESGLSVGTIGLWLRSFASGFQLSEVKFEKDAKDHKDVVFTMGSSTPRVEDVSRVAIPIQQGTVPIAALGSFVTKENPTVISREDGKRTISVFASVRPGFSISDKNKSLEAFADTLKLPEGYSWKTGGVNEENAKSVTSIIQAMGLAFVLILVTMVIQFKSYRQAAIVLMVIPLAVSSVFAIFAITGTPLSFPALIGVLSLFGIVVTNSMFIVDKININSRQGMPFVEAIADAGASRLEPIILTKLCTVFGLLPITLSSPLWQGLGGAIISGLLIASTIMLLFIPVVYYDWFRKEKEENENQSTSLGVK